MQVKTAGPRHRQMTLLNWVANAKRRVVCITLSIRAYSSRETVVHL